MSTPQAPGGIPAGENKEVAQLRRAIEELSILNDLARAIGGSLNAEEIMGNIIKRSLKAVGAEQGDITLIDRKAPDKMKTLIRTMASSSIHRPVHLNENLMGWMMRHRQPLIIANPEEDTRFRGVKWDPSIRSVLCTPLMVKNELIGILAVYNKRNGLEFNEDDQRLLVIIAGQSAQVVENARLYEEEKALLRVREELRVAHDIQMKLLPKAVPSFPGYDIAGRSIPAQNVGGDYFDFIRIDPNRMAVCLGDVSGKGIPAALLMANLHAIIRSQTFSSPTCAECIFRANRLLFESTDSDKFATLFYGNINKQTHEFCYCNAGHNYPLLFSKSGAPRELKKGGVMIGILQNLTFEEETVMLEAGDLIVIYSDGVTEAFNERDEEFGEERLVELVQQNRELRCTVLIEKIIQEVSDFAHDVPQSDDLTIVAIRRVE